MLTARHTPELDERACPSPCGLVTVLGSRNSRARVDAAFDEFKRSLEQLGVSTAELHLRRQGSDQLKPMYEIVREVRPGTDTGERSIPFPWGSFYAESLHAFAKITGASARRAVESLQFATEVLGVVADIQNGRTAW
jgi:hypothetical protein